MLHSFRLVIAFSLRAFQLMLVSVLNNFSNYSIGCCYQFKIPNSYLFTHLFCL